MAASRLPCLSGSCVGGEGHGRLVYVKYTWSIGNCATWCNIPAPSSCRSLVAFNLAFSQVTPVVNFKVITATLEAFYTIYNPIYYILVQGIKALREGSGKGGLFAFHLMGIVSISILPWSGR